MVMDNMLSASDSIALAQSIIFPFQLVGALIIAGMIATAIDNWLDPPGPDGFA